MSSAVFMKIFQQAEKTFSNRNRDCYKANFALLKKLVDKLVYSDLNLNPFLFSQKAFKVKVMRDVMLYRVQYEYFIRRFRSVYRHFRTQHLANLLIFMRN